jgi:UPF0755 protein
MSRRTFGFALATVLGLLVTAAVVITIFGSKALDYPEKRHAGSGKTVVVEIPRGARLPEVAEQLAAAGVIERPSWFRLYAMKRGLANKVRAGKYTLRDDQTPAEILDVIVAGVPEIEKSVTIPEGKHLKEVCAILAEAGVADAAELERVARDPAWLKEHGLEGETADGYLFPDTYRFKAGTPPGKVLATLVARHRVVYREVAEQHARALARLKETLKWTDRDVVILASIVEKETASPAERPRVAGVFFNRLTVPGFKSRRLETDPTIRYGCTIPLKKSSACQAWDPAGRLFTRQLQDAENPYNTYQHAGLPPGPIANPGRAALAAAMSPEKNDYLFFVAKNEHEHVFSRTLAEHEAAVDKYQR